MCIDDLAGLRINAIFNNLFKWLLNFELILIRTGVALPVGGSRLLVARKPTTIQKGA